MSAAIWTLAAVFICGMISGATGLLLGAILLDYLNRRKR
jgi:hypothetical protein